MSKSIALLTVLENGDHQLNIYDSVKLPAGEYDLVINPMDHHGLSRAELKANGGTTSKFLQHTASCMTHMRKGGGCVCSNREYL